MRWPCPTRLWDGSVDLFLLRGKWRWPATYLSCIRSRETPGREKNENLGPPLLIFYPLEASTGVWLFYGQPYGGAPYGQFSNRSFFPILVSFLSFSDFKKFFQEKILRKKKTENFDEKKLREKNLRNKLKKIKMEILLQKKNYLKYFCIQKQTQGKKNCIQK